MITVTSLTGAVTFGLAVLGAILGVINTIQSMRRDRVRLRVSYSNWVGSNGQQGKVVSVVNLSCFEVTVAEIFLPLGRKQKYVVMPLDYQLPKRIESRSSHSFLLKADAFQDERCPHWGRVHIKTACGVIKKAGFGRVRFGS